MASLLDFSGLSDDQLVELIRAALREAVRRGSAVEAAVRSAGLDEAERARIATTAAAREAERLREEEERRVAEAAAERIRREAEARRVAEEQAKKEELWRYKDALAQEVGRLIRPDRAWIVKVWSKGSDKRVFVTEEGADWQAKDIEYFHTGNERVKPGTLTLKYDAKYAVEQGTATEAEVRAFCERLCGRWNSFEHTTPKTSDEPPAPWPRHFVISDEVSKRPWYLSSGPEGKFGISPQSAQRFATREEAEAMLARARAGSSLDLSKYRVVVRLGEAKS